jgi:hypothetical protein
VNRIGWRKKLMTLTKPAPRGTTLEKYDATNTLLCLQSMDNNVVSLTLSLKVSGMVPVKHQVVQKHIES